jgi:hypothetical protein
VIETRELVVARGNDLRPAAALGAAVTIVQPDPGAPGVPARVANCRIGAQAV